MSKHKHSQTPDKDFSTLAEDARALMVATVDVAGERVGEARERLSTALQNVRDKTVRGAKAIDGKVRQHPYQAIAIGAGIGAVVGYLFARRSGDTFDSD
jgi:ElaB/YqjD/DUF883 family membrane-anchored ribosome-binding protein